MEFLTKRLEKLRKNKAETAKKLEDDREIVRKQLLSRNRELLQRKRVKSELLKQKVREFQRKKAEKQGKSRGKSQKPRGNSEHFKEISREKLEKLVNVRNFAISGEVFQAIARFSSKTPRKSHFFAKNLTFSLQELSFKEIAANRQRKIAVSEEKARVSLKKLEKSRRKAEEKYEKERKKREKTENTNKKVAQLLNSKEIADFFSSFQQEIAYFFDFFRTNVEILTSLGFSPEHLQYKGYVHFASFFEILGKVLTFEELQLIYRSVTRDLKLKDRIPIGFREIFAFLLSFFAFLLDFYSILLGFY